MSEVCFKGHCGFRGVRLGREEFEGVCRWDWVGGGGDYQTLVHFGPRYHHWRTVTTTRLANSSPTTPPEADYITCTSKWPPHSRTQTASNHYTQPIQPTMSTISSRIIYISLPRTNGKGKGSTTTDGRNRERESKGRRSLFPERSSCTPYRDGKVAQLLFSRRVLNES